MSQETAGGWKTTKQQTQSLPELDFVNWSNRLDRRRDADERHIRGESSQSKSPKWKTNKQTKQGFPRKTQILQFNCVWGNIEVWRGDLIQSIRRSKTDQSNNSFGLFSNSHDFFFLLAIFCFQLNIILKALKWVSANNYSQIHLPEQALLPLKATPQSIVMKWADGGRSHGPPINRTIITVCTQQALNQ